MRTSPNAMDTNFLSLLAQRVPANIFVFNLQTGASEFNSSAVATMIGYTNEDIMEMGDQLLPTLLHPDDMQIAQEDLENAARLQGDEFSTPVEYRMRAKSGEWVWFASTMRIFDHDDAGNILRVIGAAHPIRRQKEAELELIQSNELLSVIVNAIPSGVVGFDHNGQVTSINTTARKILGNLEFETPFDWPININFLNSMVDDLPEGKSPVERTLSGEIIEAEVFSIISPIGDTKYLEISSAENTLGMSTIKSILVLDDITKQEKQRQTIERSNRLDAVGQLAGGIAHDFNNLLATVQYALQLTKNDQCSEKQLKYLDTALKSVRSGADLTKRLLTFAKHQPGLEKSRHVNEAIQDIHKLATPLIEANISLEIQSVDADLWVYCDPVQLDNALLNLLINARDAIVTSGEGNKVTLFARSVPQVDTDVTLRREHPNSYIGQGLHDEHHEDQSRKDNAAYRYIEFGVTDNGPGMPNEVKNRAVDPFYTTKEHNSGTGLGLSMVYGFVQHAGGELRIYSEEGQGTTIRILLPRGTPAGIREEPIRMLDKATGKGEHILLVEDDADLLVMLDDLISSLGYKTTCIQSGSKALELAELGNDYDLMITDIVMPGDMDGFELAKLMRRARPDVKLLYTSGYTGYSEKDMKGIVAPLLQKPCDPVELANAINDALLAKANK